MSNLFSNLFLSSLFKTTDNYKLLKVAGAPPHTIRTVEQKVNLTRVRQEYKLTLDQIIHIRPEDSNRLIMNELTSALINHIKDDLYVEYEECPITRTITYRVRLDYVGKNEYR